MRLPGTTRTMEPLLAAALILAWPVSSGGAPGVPATGTASDHETLVRVDGEPVTSRDLLALLSSQRRPAPGADVSGISAEGVLKRLIQNRLMEQEGIRLGMDESVEIRRQVHDLARHRAMIALLDSLQSTVPAPDPVATAPAEPLTSTMLRVSHILVANEAEARALRDSLHAGVPFAELAERHSLDTEWSSPDGDLGWSREDKFIPEFAAALQGLSQGEVSEPVSARDGWHLLLITETHTETVAGSGTMADAIEEAEMRERVMGTVRAFVDSLRSKYQVTTNDSLLATLDYGTEDDQVLRDLQKDDRVLAVLPWVELSVADLTREIRFEHFHGLKGKANAAELRDRKFEDWITQALLRHEAVELGFHEKPEIVRAAEALRREQLRAAVGNMILDVPFDPDDADVERYHREHLDQFTSRVRIRVDGVVIADEPSARRFRARLEAGARMSWLAERTRQIKDPDPGMLDGWLDPDALGLPVEGLESGAIIGPVEADGGWAVAQILDVRPGQPAPLERCRGQVEAAMRNDAMRATMNAALARLESEATIQVADGAEDRIRKQIDEWLQGGTSVSREVRP